jgi:hypothetical protein
LDGELNEGDTATVDVAANKESLMVEKTTEKKKTVKVS